MTDDLCCLENPHFCVLVVYTDICMKALTCFIFHRWYFGKVSRNASEEWLLAPDQPKGTFLVRLGEMSPGMGIKFYIYIFFFFNSVCCKCSYEEHNTNHPM